MGFLVHMHLGPVSRWPCARCSAAWEAANPHLSPEPPWPCPQPHDTVLFHTGFLHSGLSSKSGPTVRVCSVWGGSARSSSSDPVPSCAPHSRPQTGGFLQDLELCFRTYMVFLRTYLRSSLALTPLHRLLWLYLRLYHKHKPCASYHVSGCAFFMLLGVHWVSGIQRL